MGEIIPGLLPTFRTASDKSWAWRPGNEATKLLHVVWSMLVPSRVWMKCVCMRVCARVCVRACIQFNFTMEQPAIYLRSVGVYISLEVVYPHVYMHTGYRVVTMNLR